MHYDAVIIGAGLSGLAAGIRLAYFDRKVCIVEKHYAYGGLNSYYTLDGRKFDVGLHALTNYAPRGAKGAPLTKLLRQLRIDWHELALRQQNHSLVQFPGRALRFDNDVDCLTAEVAREFPASIDRFRRLVGLIADYDDTRLDAVYQSARAQLRDLLGDPVLIDMLLCPIMFYGSPTEHDMDFTHFVTMFKSLFLQGFARPVGGVRTIISLLVKKFRGLGGKLRMQCGVRRIVTKGDRVTHVELENGEELTGDLVLSCAGYPETMRLCGGEFASIAAKDVGRVSFVESMAVLDVPPPALGHHATIVFYNDRDEFSYEKPRDLVDLRSGILCCPDNYDGGDEATKRRSDEGRIRAGSASDRFEEATEATKPLSHGATKSAIGGSVSSDGLLRLTWLANYDRWSGLDESAYRREKDRLYDEFLSAAGRWVPGVGEHLTARDMFTPRTIHRYTGRINGAVYGSIRKIRDGTTPWRNLFLCGTDQGFLGIIGAMLSGISMANLHGLADH